MDLKYLTVDDLERFLVNLKASIEDLESKARQRYDDQRLKEEKALYAEIESEILERTVLGYKPPGGATT